MAKIISHVLPKAIITTSLNERIKKSVFIHTLAVKSVLLTMRNTKNNFLRVTEDTEMYYSPVIESPFAFYSSKVVTE